MDGFLTLGSSLLS